MLIEYKMGLHTYRQDNSPLLFMEDNETTHVLTLLKTHSNNRDNDSCRYSKLPVVHIDLNQILDLNVFVHPR